MTVIRYILVILLSYVLGCSNMALYLSKLRGVDMRKGGSGNLGASNAMILMGWKAGTIVAVHDIGKAVVAVVLAKHFCPGLPLIGAAAGVACVLGHMFPVFFGLRGGKGILSGGVLVLLLDWRVALIAWGLFVSLWLLTRYVSLGSVAATASMPVSVFFLLGHNWLYTVLSAAIAALVIWCHRGNIQRLLSGTEKKFHWHVDAPAGGEDGPQA